MNKNKQDRDYYWYLGKHLITFLVLSVLNQDTEDAKGWTAYNLIKKIKEASGDKIFLRAGSLYPLIQKMEEKDRVIKKDIELQKSRSTGTRREKAIYSITDLGRAEFKKMSEEWKEIEEFIWYLLGDTKKGLENE